MNNETKELKTTTWCYAPDDPQVSFVDGHVSLADFNKAHVAEGWTGDPLSQEDVKHEYWIIGEKTWEQADKDSPGAMPVTASYW